MTNGIYVALSGNVAVEKNMNVVSNNLANADTTGFKKDRTVFSEYVHKYRLGEIDEKMIENGTLQDKSFTDVDDVFTDFSLGSFKETGNPLDLALSGDAFFKVQKGEEIQLQRAGQFVINSDGQITAQDGALLLNSDGIPIAVDPEKTVNINEKGDVYQEDQLIGTIWLATADNKTWMEKISDTRYRITGDGNEIPGKGEVYQGFLERSNINPVAEMVEMIKVNRHYEAASKAVKAYQSMDEKAINKVGSV